MDAESFAKAAAITAPYDPAYCGSKPLNPKPTPPSSSPSSTAVPASKTSSMLAPITSVPRFFGSLLYEACGRIVNPIYGAAGLLWSGNWHLCHAAVEAVLHGSPIVQLSPDSELSTMSPPLKACDIRHVSKDESSAASRDLHKVKCRSRFKRAAGKPKVEVEPSVDEAAQVMWSWSNKKESASHDSVVSHQEEPPSHGGESGDGDSMSVETVEASLAAVKPDCSDVELELTLGFEPYVRAETGEGLVKDWGRGDRRFIGGHV